MNCLLSLYVFYDLYDIKLNYPFKIPYFKNKLLEFYQKIFLLLQFREFEDSLKIILISNLLPLRLRERSQKSVTIDI
jgi:hypothetical protein